MPVKAAAGPPGSELAGSELAGSDETELMPSPEQMGHVQIPLERKPARLVDPNQAVNRLRISSRSICGRRLS
jgi:hypothetical protein